MVSDQVLKEALSEALGPVSALHRRASPQASTAHLEDLRVELVDGPDRLLVLKTGGRDTAREVALYRDVLAGAALGTPGWVAGSTDGWLVLDRVAGKPLWQSGDAQDWCAVARWLRAAHAQLASHRELQVAHGWAEHLDRAIARHPPASTLAAAHARAVQIVESAPQTLVHGELFPANILLTGDGQPCVLDWETAGPGSGLTDLAALTAGWAPAAAQQIEVAYGGDLTALPAARLVVAIRWLGEPRPPAAAGGGRARWTDWWAAALVGANGLPA